MASLVGSSVYAVRVLISTVLFTFFGYISPVLSSVKSIVNGDQDGMKEWVTYWVVQASLLYLETLLSAFRCFKAYPPELRVVCALWLTLPRFQGAYRIYTVLLQPYFEKYEDDIDRHVERLAGHVRQRASRHVQTILWQLFLAPQDGLVAGLGIGSLIQGSGLALAALQGGALEADSALQLPPDSATASPRPASASAVPGLTPTRAAIQRQLLEETSKLLLEGICVFAGRRALGLVPCQLTLLEEGDGCSGARAGGVSAGMLQIAALEGGECWSLPLRDIVDMDLVEGEAEEEEGSIICLRCRGAATFVREEEAEGGETEALLAGLRALVASVRGPRLRAVRDKGEGKGEDKGEGKEGRGDKEEHGEKGEGKDSVGGRGERKGCKDEDEEQEEDEDDEGSPTPVRNPHRVDEQDEEEGEEDEEEGSPTPVKARPGRRLFSLDLDGATEEEGGREREEERGVRGAEWE